MILIAGQTYRCQNSACRAEIQVTKSSVEGASNPRCCCGSEMKKPYVKPVPKTVRPVPEFGRALE